MKKIIIDQEIFNRFPDFKRGLLIVRDIKNNLNCQAISQLLAQEIKSKINTDLNHDFIKAWDQAHLKFNSNPNKFPPSIKSLIKRINKGAPLPFINSAVALFNYISLKYLIPCGGDDVGRIEGNLKLGIAHGDEKFISLGSLTLESPEPGEIIYFDDKTLNIMCRKWNWRNGDFTKITENSKKIVINLDGIGPVEESVVLQARDKLANLLINECQADLTADLLNIKKQEIEINL